MSVLPLNATMPRASRCRRSRCASKSCGGGGAQRAARRKAVDVKAAERPSSEHLSQGELEACGRQVVARAQSFRPSDLARVIEAERPDGRGDPDAGAES